MDDIEQRKLTQKNISIHQKNERYKDLKSVVLSFIGVLTFLILWQLLLEYKIIPSRSLSKPTQVIHIFLVKLSDPRPEGATLIKSIYTSLIVVLIGFNLAVIIGVPLGLLMGWFKGVESLIRPVFELLRPIPPVAWIPITILSLGIGLAAKTFIIFFAAFIPIIINSYTGVKLTTRAHINVAKTFGASKWQIFFRVCIPSAMPMVFTGLRISLGAAWATLVAAEMIAANAGLGFMISMGRTFARPDLIVLGMLVIGVIGALLAIILTKIENHVLSWRKML